jgi:hypothetical protein
VQNLDGPKAKYCFHLLGIMYVYIYLDVLYTSKTFQMETPQFIEDAIS